MDDYYIVVTMRDGKIISFKVLGDDTDLPIFVCDSWDALRAYFE
jgi:hypothetical protein